GAELFGRSAGAGFGGGRWRPGGAAGGGALPRQRIVHLQGADPAAAHRRDRRQLAARSSAAQALAGAGGRPGGACRGPSRPHVGGDASLVVGRARGLVVEWGDVVGGRAARAVV